MTPFHGQAQIQIRGAGTHNLREIDVDLPLGKLIAISGVSGSGKSSLAFDTLFAEGQRRYLESVSVHTRSLLKQLPRPQVQQINGLPPTVSVDQRVTAAPARSTLAVTTEIYDYLRLLYARAGRVHCTKCGLPVESQSVEEIIDRILALPQRTKLMVISPLVRSRKGAHKDVFERIARHGFVRVRVDGQLYDVNDIPELKPTLEHSIDAVIDRIIVKDRIQQRLRESVQLAVRESEGTCIISCQTDNGWQDRLFSTQFSCTKCDVGYSSPEPRAFSFNSAWGACETCEGFGIRGITDQVDDIVVFRQAPCEACHGTRLQPFARSITLFGLSITDVTAKTVDETLHLIQTWEHRAQDELSARAKLAAEKTLPDIAARLQCLQRVGLGYLQLNRATRTLSGGEFQRARLAACLGAGLHGACFVLDEPTSGLHARDTQRLLKLLKQIQNSGATVVVVEHDSEVINAADYLLDIGPGAGSEGGRVVFAGAPADAISDTQSVTGPYLANELTQNVASACQSSNDAGSLIIQNARRNNLKNVTVEIPLQRFVCVTGVSGSGKSSLIMETLLPVVAAHVSRTAEVKIAAADADCDDVQGLEAIQKLVAVDHRPLSRNRRSCIATYTKIWSEIRRLLASTKSARARGFSAGRFSFNSGDGRCSACKGTGVQDIKMSLLPDAIVPCSVCDGRRFNKATLQVTFANHNAVDILNLRVDEAVDLFSEIRSLRRILSTLQEVGLGYLTLGQPSSTFSGGEAQRVRLATELATDRQDATLYILDEPTSGLHPSDVEHLITLLCGLVKKKHTVVVVEHNMQMMKASHYLIDIGPDSGDAGGEVVAAGAVQEIVNCRASHTGFHLAGRNQMG